MFNEDSEDVKDFWKKHWYCIRTIDTETSQELEFYLPNEKFVEQFRLFKKKMLDKVRGLQLLMPQYHRRVEVEDLDENFWVISVILDAVVNALWGPYGLIDVVRQLILKVTQIEDFLGLDKLTGIELLHSGSDDMYFDMYSRFTLSGLELKLKTQNGERIIKNIFKGQSDTTDRKSTTDAYSSREELFAGIQFNEITPVENDLGSTGLYDSDLISSNSNVNLSNGKAGYLSLSTVIDAINNRITSDGNNKLSVTYDYSIGDGQDFFSRLDITPDGTLTPNDLKQISEDIIGDFSNLTQYELSRLVKYQNAKEFLINEFNADNKSEYWQNIFTKFGIETVEDIEKLFITKKGTMTFSTEELDANGDNVLSDDEWLKYANGQLSEIEAFISEVKNNIRIEYNEGKITTDSVTAEFLLNGGQVTTLLNLIEMYKKLEIYFYRQDNSADSEQILEDTEDSAEDTIISDNTTHFLEIIDINSIESAVSGKLYRRAYTKNNDDTTLHIVLRNDVFDALNFGDSEIEDTQIKILDNNDSSVLAEINKLNDWFYGYDENKNRKWEKITKVIVYNNVNLGVAENGTTYIVSETKPYIESCIRSWIKDNNKIISLLEDNGYKIEKINTAPYNKMGVSPLEDIYTYNEFTAQLIAQYITAESNTTSQYENFADEINSYIGFYNYYFDTSEMDLNISENANPGISVYDCSKIITYLNSTNDALYFKNMKMLRNSILS